MLSISLRVRRSLPSLLGEVLLIGQRLSVNCKHIRLCRQARLVSVWLVQTMVECVHRTIGRLCPWYECWSCRQRGTWRCVCVRWLRGSHSVQEITAWRRLCAANLVGEEASCLCRLSRKVVVQLICFLEVDLDLEKFVPVGAISSGWEV